MGKQEPQQRGNMSLTAVIAHRENDSHVWLFADEREEQNYREVMERDADVVLAGVHLREGAAVVMIQPLEMTIEVAPDMMPENYPEDWDTDEAEAREEAAKQEGAAQ